MRSPLISGEDMPALVAQAVGEDAAMRSPLISGEDGEPSGLPVFVFTWPQ